MFTIIIASVIVCAAIVALLYFISREISIREMPELPKDWDFSKAKAREQKFILLIGNN